MFVHHDGRDLEVLVHRADATDADLAAAVGAPRPARPRPLADLGLVNGGELGIALGRPPPAARCPAPAVVVTGGPVAGRCVPAPPGTVLDVGRGDPVATAGAVPAGRLVLDDPAVSRLHARVAIGHDGGAAVADASSTNGSWLLREGHLTAVDGPVALGPGAEVRLGRSRLALRPAPALGGGAPLAPDPAPAPGEPPRAVIAGRRPDPVTGTTPFNRPPRPAGPPAPDPVEVPHAPTPAGARIPLGVVAVLGPLAMAGAMVWLLGNPAFALVALLSPVLAVGGHLEGRRRERRGARRRSATWAAELEAFRAALGAAAVTERARRLAGAPDPAEVLRRAEGPATTLWERRPADEDWLRLRVGTGAVPWSPPRRGEPHGPRHPDVAAAVAEVALLPAAPVTVDLAGGGVVGIVGPRHLATAVARCLLLQAVVHHGPSDLQLLVACAGGALDDWGWTKWLPHVEDPAGGPRRLAADREAADGLAAARIDLARAARAGATRPAPVPTLLALVDGEELLDGRRAPLRALLDGRAGPAAGLVVVEDAARLPASCSAVVVLDGDGAGELVLPAAGTRVAVDVDGIEVVTAAAAARALAGVDDPELGVAGAGLPAVVALLDLLGPSAAEADAVLRRWVEAGADPPPATPLGLDAAGVVTVDLAADGPHVLVAGTTGAGKSELLRSLVAGLAAGSSPDHLTFLLVDFKGGSAFDACARLPHAVGLVTDLDAELAERALRCLEAELRHRERLLRAAGAPDLAALRARPGHEPLPRLVVVVDEFATLRAELPGFVDALVGVAQRGRSLGVHLVLATQRPAGSVSEHIKANADLRIALRVQDTADSVDVVDRPDAAALPRHRPGRACVRFGPGELVTVQTALATAPPSSARPPVEAHPFAFGPWPSGTGVEPPPGAAAGGPSDLDRLVDACTTAFERSGRPRPRRPWPPPLPARLTLEALAALAPGDAGPPGLAVVGVADDPDGQRQVPAGWRPADGNLVVYGVTGSGTSTTLLALARALAAGTGPDDLHLYAIDGGPADLAALEVLPHAVAVVGPTERERQQRLVRRLRAELDRRRSAPGRPRPHVVLLVDGVGRFLTDFDDLAGLEVADAFDRVFLDGPAVGIHVVAAAERVGALPAALAATVRQRWLHRLADGHDAAAAGLAGAGARCADLPPGRFLDATTGLAVQVAVPGARGRLAPPPAGTPRGATPCPPPPPPAVGPDRVVAPCPSPAAPALGSDRVVASCPSPAAPGVASDRVVAPCPSPPPWPAAPALGSDPVGSPGLPPAIGPAGAAWAGELTEVAAGWPAPAAAPPPVVAMPATVVLAAVPTADLDRRPWQLPIGVSDDDAPASLVLHEGDHVLVAGPGRSGRTTALATVAAALRRARPDARLVALAGRRSWLRDLEGLHVVADPGSAAALAEGAGEPLVLLVDDAEALDDPGGHLAALLLAEGVHVVAAVRNDVARSLYQHWTRTVRRSRLGLLLRPDADLDGELLGAVLPRRSPAPWVPGRGYLVVDGAPVLAQVARCKDAAP